MVLRKHLSAGRKMASTWLLLLLTLAIAVRIGSGQSSLLKRCPAACTCDLDQRGLYQTTCTKVEWRAIPVHDFEKEVEVIVIKGSKNSLNIGPIFQTFSKLEMLRITNANVPAIGMNSFWGLVRLRTLDLSRNNITQIIVDNFRGQDNLLELDLSKNRMERIASGTFGHLKSLKSLNLADNSIDELNARLFLHLAKLKYLDLSRNPIDDLPPEVFKDVQELKVLKVRGCHLLNVNPQVYNMLTHLNELDLGQNQFTYLVRSEFKDLKRLRVLRLDGNQLSAVVDRLFEYQKGLNVLDLSSNRLAKISETAFENLSNLTYLDVSYNKLSRVEPESLEPLTRLQTFNLSGNLQLDLMEVEPTFQIIPNISTLAVADMGPLPIRLFAPFRQLRALNLSGNHIDNNTLQIILPLTQLQLLDLSRNQLSGVEERFATQLSQIADLRIENNPLICDRCHMGALIDMAEKLPWGEKAECFLPENLRGLTISKLVDDARVESCMEVIVDEDHDAASTSHNFLEQAGSASVLAFCGLILFVILAIIVVSTAICFSRHRARYYTHEDKREATLEKNGTETSLLTATGSEINFKFPYNDRVCTIDEMCIPAPPPPPSSGGSKVLASNVIERFD
ncbi:insulin-like growth factor-binding protein complex acid labile subunit [Culex pipiens pallens]|uniref:insulin-like growth factor-binding protein complex acid labile subunit n=1 Tax=Culex pipiens pallens TaxID=42434 RepID=UPI0019534615|nr:insulin-like growth factor-binding protein complex acid labile subunit [Culex pipiens pallens]